MYHALYLGLPLESSSDIDSMKNIVHELYIRTRGNKNSMIAISPIFSPKIKITEKLSQTSLRRLIYIMIMRKVNKNWARFKNGMVSFFIQG